MNQCARIDWERSDELLNDAYQRVRYLLKQRDKEFNLRTLKSLIRAQRGWIDYRDGHCEVVASKAHGGSIEPLLYHSCRAELTRARFMQFKRTLDGTD